jgi:hypothetical protein
MYKSVLGKINKLQKKKKYWVFPPLLYQVEKYRLSTLPAVSRIKLLDFPLPLLYKGDNSCIMETQQPDIHLKCFLFLLCEIYVDHHAKCQ